MNKQSQQTNPDRDSRNKPDSARSRRASKRTLRGLWRLAKVALPVALIAVIAYLAFAPAPVAVDLAVVSRGPLSITIDDEGETQVRERYLITAPLPGRVLRLSLEPGNAISKGQTMATIIPEAPRLLDPRTMAQAKAAVSAAEAGFTHAEEAEEIAVVEFETAEKSFARSRKLHFSGSMSDAEYESAERVYLAAEHSRHAAESDVGVAFFQMEQARAALLHAERLPTVAPDTTDPDDLYHFTITAPVDGAVLRVPEKSTRPVAPGTALLEIGDPTDLEIRVDVLSQDAVRIQPGQRVMIDHWGGTQPISGTVRQVEPSAFTKVSALGVNEQRVNVLIDFSPPPANHGEIGDGYRVEAQIVVWEADDVLLVPTAALFRQGQGWAVYRSTPNDRAELVPVIIDHRGPDTAELVDGLAEGDLILLHPGDRISDATRIEPRS